LKSTIYMCVSGEMLVYVGIYILMLNSRTHQGRPCGSEITKRVKNNFVLVSHDIVFFAMTYVIKRFRDDLQCNMVPKEFILDKTGNIRGRYICISFGE
jgi:hypothetical protein